MSSTRIDTDTLRRLPKAVLHDHLDGGLRPATVVELAAAVGHTLPTTDPDELAAWYFDAANSGDLVRYIATFEHTLAVMQNREGLLRTAEEYVLDLAADGVVYGEVRYAPELNTSGGLALAEVVETVQEGLAAGMAKAAAAGTPVQVRTLLCGMRMFDRVGEAADLAVAFRDAGVVGFDIAGAEDGFPPADHLAAFEHLRRESVPFTIHAGEAHGLPSIHQALQVCGAQRIGHGVRITEDIVDGKLGRLAYWVRDRRIALEMCPTSNLQTGAATSIAEHPITALKDLGFRVTLNTDNRLVSGTTMTREMSLLVEEARLDDRGPAHRHGERPQERVHPVRRAQGPHRGRRPARLRLRALKQPAHIRGLSDVLQIVGQDADQPDAQGDRRIPALVHDPVVVLRRQSAQVRQRLVVHGVVVPGELPGRLDPHLADLRRGVAVARVLG